MSLLPRTLTVRVYRDHVGDTEWRDVALPGDDIQAVWGAAKVILQILAEAPDIPLHEKPTRIEILGDGGDILVRFGIEGSSLVEMDCD